MRVPKLAGGPDGEIGLLGGAAPLSSRKTGYVLRLAHMNVIIFPTRFAPKTGSGPVYSYFRENPDFGHFWPFLVFFYSFLILLLFMVITYIIVQFNIKIQ